MRGAGAAGNERVIAAEILAPALREFHGEDLSIERKGLKWA
jgi:hypothetical protein